MIFTVTGAPVEVASNLNGGDSSTVTVTLTTTQPNDLIYISAAIGDAQSFASITSNPSLTWTPRASVTNTVDTLAAWYAIMPTSGQITISITLNGGNSHWVTTVFAVSGANNASPFDGTAVTNSGDSTTASASIITSHANDLIIGALDAQGTNALTTGTGYNLIITEGYTGYREISDEYKTVSTTGTYTPSYTFTKTNWDMIADAIQGVP
jgi:hypothetical protein